MRSGFFKYFPGKSIIHKLDPRTKYHFTLILVVLILLYDNPIFLAAAFILTIGLFYLSGVPISAYYNAIKILLLSILFLLIFNGFFIPGKIILLDFSLPLIGYVSYSLAGLISSLSLGLRFLTLFFMVPVVISTTKPVDIITSLNYLKIPYKISFIAAISIRFFPTLEDVMIEVMESQRSRGLETEKGNLLQKIKKSLPIVYPMIYKCLYFVDQLSWTIESRGYGLSKNPTIIRELKYQKMDYILTGISWIILILIPLYLFIFADLLNVPYYLRPWLNLAGGPF
jgi:energy-coupling factor transport system permease protein